MAAWTLEDTIRQRHALLVSACRVAARLRCIGWIYPYHLTTGPFCLVREILDELVPGCILNRLSETMVVYHIVDGKVLNHYGPKPVDEFSGVLMGKVRSPVGDTFVNPGKGLPS